MLKDKCLNAGINLTALSSLYIKALYTNTMSRILSKPYYPVQFSSSATILTGRTLYPEGCATVPYKRER
jgi:hypothetical protein